jgi:hypothetical protein
MTLLAKMGVAPTEPLSDVAAELTLELNVVKSVLFTVLDPTLDPLGGALSTHQLFFLKTLLVFLLIHLTVFQSTKVRYLAFEAFIVSQLEEAEILKLPIVSIARVF